MTQNNGQTAKEITVRRDGDRDLSFEGVLLGSGSMETGTGRGTDVSLFKTKSGKYVVSVRAWTAWEGEHDSHRAGVCDTAEVVLDWLVQDAGGQLGRASKEALESAAKEDDGIAAVVVERVD